MNNLSSYCVLFDEKIRASDKDLPVMSFIIVILFDFFFCTRLFLKYRLQSGHQHIFFHFQLIKAIFISARAIMKVSRINLAVKLFDRISVQKYFHHIEIRQFQTYISFLCQISARVCLHQPIQVVFFFIFIFEKKLPYFCRLDSSLYLIKDTKIFFDTLTFMMISNKF